LDQGFNRIKVLITKAKVNVRVSIIVEVQIKGHFKVSIRVSKTLGQGSMLGTGSGSKLWSDSKSKSGSK